MPRSRGLVLAPVLSVIALVGSGSVAASHALADPAPAGQGMPTAGGAVEIRAPSKQAGTTVARVVANSPLYSAPGAGRQIGRVRTATDWSGAPQYLMVLGSAMHDGRQWLLVRLPWRPNDARGWLLRDRVELLHSPWFLELSLTARRLSLYRQGRRVASYRAVIGHPKTPTPTGLFAILERVRQPDPKGFLGPWAIHLTAHSEVLRRFDGGPGRIAIHGRGGLSFRDPLGSARSNGCIRIDNGPVKRLVRLLPGTAVRVRR